MIDVSVLIVTWNSEKYIRDCLDSIYSFTRSCSFEVLVVDNGSSDNTAGIIRNDFPAVRLFEAGANLGFARSTNAALKLAAGNYFFILNPDIRFEMDVIGELIGFLKANPGAGAAGARTMEKDGSTDIYHARELPSIRDCLFAQFGLKKAFPESPFFAREIIPGWGRLTVRAVPFISGAAIMIPREVFKEVGCLDEEIPMYFEDLDICARIGAAGRPLYFVPSAVLTHLGGMSARISPAKSVLYALENAHAPWLFFKRHRPGRQRLFTSVVFAGSLSRLIFFGAFLPFARMKGEAAAEMFGDQVLKARALLKWSFSKKESFVREVRRIFPSSSKNEAIEALFADGNKCSSL